MNQREQFQQVLKRRADRLQSADFYDSREWQELRYRALKKNNGACQCCGHRGDSTNPLQVDHIRPRSVYPGLALEISNLQVLCRTCNMGKGNKDITDWRHAPSHELSILNEIEPQKRFRLQQLGWLKLNGESKQMRTEAAKEYRTLWRQVEAEWIASRKAAE